MGPLQLIHRINDNQLINVHAYLDVSSSHMAALLGRLVEATVDAGPGPREGEL
jgi:hypothetical protein